MARVTTMRAVVLSKPGPVENLQIRILPIPLQLDPSHTYRLDQIREAHQAMDTNTVSGKRVVPTGSEP